MICCVVQLARRMLGDREMDETPTFVREEHQDEEHAARHGRHREKVHRNHGPQVIGEERSPCLRWPVGAADAGAARPCALRHRCPASAVRRESAPQNGFAALIFAMSAPRTTSVDWRPRRDDRERAAPPSALPLAMPAYDGIRLDEDERLAPVPPRVGEEDPEDSVACL
jgi:hypothetical protein